MPETNSPSSVHAPHVTLLRKLGAEFVGSFILIFSAAAAPIVNQKYQGSETLLGNAACAGLAVMAVILSTGHISGAHLNPSVTIAFAAFRHFPWTQVPLYIIAQVSASISASFALKGVFHPFMSGGVTVPSVSHYQAFALEFIVTFILMFTVTSVATDTRAVGELAGVAIGATVLLNILVAGQTTGGSMNPIRTLGPAVAAGNYKGLWIYLVAPTLGALAGAATYTAVKLPHNQIHDEADGGTPLPQFYPDRSPSIEQGRATEPRRA
ncbi:aquaporin NIP5-1 [Pyrus ussuriensis x Pyrus communis]|uniref:Aquaporin NIP5-1 n=1 Tax=Pyrus ussuriensis x Pyrus communis TaxID=2448454 RepID=A0A5N5GD74_9ROSA|nr:aquaporin NIP5-1 [Pyrus ussuriensis x Pyrus communis]